MAERAPQLPRADVCVVGAGPAGLAVARALGRAGRRVVLLESGADGASPIAAELADGDHEGEPYEGLRATRHRGVGGTSNIWDVDVEGQPGAKYVPLDPGDFADWPIGPEELAPFYREAQALCGLGPFDYGAARWAGPDRRPFDLSGTGLVSGVYQFGTADRFTGELPAELRRTEAVTLVPSTTVVGLTDGASGRSIGGVRAVGPEGDPVEIEARRVVLACGAVENARLLLRAGLGGRDGLAWLGRGFMEHARDFSMTLVPGTPAVFSEAAFYDLHEPAEGVRVGGRLGLAAEAREAHDLPNAALTLIPRARGTTRPGLWGRIRGRLRGGGAGRETRYGWSRVADPAGAYDVFGLVLNLEQRPDVGNRVEPGDRRDRFGHRLPRLVLRWSDEEQARLERLRGLLAGWLRDAGLGELSYEAGRRPDLSAHHHAGTTRMAASPDEGVVDPDARVFGVEGLYVAGASVFPTAGYANPTLTVVAQALRLAEHLDGELG